LEGDTWCLLVPNNAVMAKVRNMLPSLAAHLRAKGFDIKTIRLKIEGR
jgi:ethanolamine ammonia-lyase small subunit